MNKNEIIKRFDEEAFVKATLDQISQDFLKVGIEIQFSEEDMTSRELFMRRLSSDVEAVMREAPQLLTKLLYLVDLSEVKVSEILNFSEKPSDDLAEALLFRAAQKVFFREKYKSHKL